MQLSIQNNFYYTNVWSKPVDFIKGYFTVTFFLPFFFNRHPKCAYCFKHDVQFLLYPIQLYSTFFRVEKLTLVNGIDASFWYIFFALEM